MKGVGTKYRSVIGEYGLESPELGRVRGGDDWLFEGCLDEPEQGEEDDQHGDAEDGIAGCVQKARLASAAHEKLAFVNRANAMYTGIRIMAIATARAAPAPVSKNWNVSW